MKDKQTLTPREYAELREIHVDKVLGWIADGSLRALNLAASTSGRPRWRIPIEEIERFEQTRLSAPVTSPPPRRRRSGTQNDVEQFV